MNIFSLISSISNPCSVFNSLSNLFLLFLFVLIWSHLLKKSLMENFIFCGVIMKLLEGDLKSNKGIQPWGKLIAPKREARLVK